MYQGTPRSKAIKRKKEELLFSDTRIFDVRMSLRLMIDEAARLN